MRSFTIISIVIVQASILCAHVSSFTATTTTTTTKATRLSHIPSSSTPKINFFLPANSNNEKNPLNIRRANNKAFFTRLPLSNRSVSSNSSTTNGGSSSASVGVAPRIPKIIKRRALRKLELATSEAYFLGVVAILVFLQQAIA